MDKRYTKQELADLFPLDRAMEAAEIFAPRRAMEAVDRKEFLMVETSNPEAGCTGCHFEGKGCPHEFNIAGWDCAPGANLVFIKRASIKGAIIKLVV